MKMFTVGFEFQFLELSFIGRKDSSETWVWTEDDVVCLQLKDTLSVYADELTRMNPLRKSKKKLFSCVSNEGELSLETTGEQFTMKMDEDLDKNFNEAEILALDIHSPLFLEEKEWDWGIFQRLVHERMKRHLREWEEFWENELVEHKVIKCWHKTDHKRARNVSSDKIPWTSCFVSKHVSQKYGTTMNSFTQKQNPGGDFRIGFLTMDPNFSISTTPFHVQCTVGIEITELLSFISMLFREWTNPPEFMEELLSMDCGGCEIVRAVVFCYYYEQHTWKNRKAQPFFVRHRMMDLATTFLTTAETKEKAQSLGVPPWFVYGTSPQTWNERIEYDEQYDLVGCTVFPIQPNNRILVELRYLHEMMFPNKELLTIKKLSSSRYCSKYRPPKK